MSRIEKLEHLIKIVGAIEAFGKRHTAQLEHACGETFYGSFPELRRNAANRADTIRRCIDRLENKYQSIIKTL